MLACCTFPMESIREIYLTFDSNEIRWIYGAAIGSFINL